MREWFEAWMKSITHLFQKAQAHATHESHLQEEIERTSRNLHASLKKALEEVENLKSSNQRLREARETIGNQLGLEF